MVKAIVLAEGLAVGLFFLCWSPAAKAADEKQLFIDQKCNRCHAVSALDIAKKGGGEDEEDADEKSPPPDLSGVGKDHDAAFFTAYLKKEVAHVPHPGVSDNKKHKVKFKGTDEEVTRMANWLVTLKSEPKK